MAVHRLNLEEDEEDFALFAIHCGEAPFKLAFLMNQNLNWHLKREREDLQIERAACSRNILAIAMFQNTIRWIICF